MRISTAFSILLSFGYFAATKAQVVDLRCDFILHGGPYTCILFGINFPDSPSIWFRFTGQHVLPDMNNLSVEKVHMSFSSAPFMIKDFFIIFNNLADLQIIGAGLKIIEQGDFVNARTLKSLIITGNPELKTLPDHILSGAWNLLSIQFHSNSIEDIQENAFWGVGALNPLEGLNLNGNNISHLHYNSFRHLTRLRRFFIADNKLERIDGRLLINSPLLSQMDFSRNKINAIERNFGNRFFIQMLRMDGNLCVDASWMNQTGIEVDLIRQGLATCFNNFDEIPDGPTAEFILKLRGTMVIRHENGTEIVRISP